MAFGWPLGVRFASEPWWPPLSVQEHQEPPFSSLPCPAMVKIATATSCRAPLALTADALCLGHETRRKAVEAAKGIRALDGAKGA